MNPQIDGDSEFATVSLSDIKYRKLIIAYNGTLPHSPNDLIALFDYLINYLKILDYFN